MKIKLMRKILKNHKFRRKHRGNILGHKVLKYYFRKKIKNIRIESKNSKKNPTSKLHVSKNTFVL